MKDSLYHLCGDLVLEDPSLFLDGPKRTRLAELMPYFRQLDQKQGTDTTNPVQFDYGARFVVFQKEETALWNHSRSAKELVRPSGELDSPIAHHLHNPSFNTNYLNGIETADETNACIYLVMKNGFEKGKTLIFDHLARREKSEDVDGINAYPSGILKCHEDFMEDVRTHMLATVEIVWGAPVRTRMMKVYREKGNPLEPLQLWGRYKEVTLFLEWDLIKVVSDQTQRLKRIIVFVMHPQVFLQPWGRKHARLQDLKLSVAGKLARVVTIVDFYQKRPWTSKNDFIRLVCRQQARELEREASRAVDAANRRKNTKSLRDLEHEPQKIVSTSRLREILNAELSATYVMDDLADVDESGDFSYLPKGIQEWLTGQPHILFEGQAVSTFTELIPFYRKYCTSSDDLPIEAISPMDMILELMKMQLKRLNALQTRGEPSVVDKWSFYRFGKSGVMKVKCNSCKQSLADDKNTRWSIVDPAFYITRKTTKHNCKPGSRFQAIPQYRNIKFIQPNLDQLKNPKWQEPRADWERLMRTKEGNLGLPIRVESWCIQCRENTTVTKLSGGGSVFVDLEPRWTVGTPAKYLERRPKCLTCNRESNRFIPVDDQIQSITKEGVVTFAEEFGDIMNDAELAMALQRRPRARREKRILKPPRKRKGLDA